MFLQTFIAQHNSSCVGDKLTYELLNIHCWLNFCNKNEIIYVCISQVLIKQGIKL